MEDLDTNYFEKIKDGAIIVAGKNFGCGSSREHAPIVIKGIWCWLCNSRNLCTNIL